MVAITHGVYVDLNRDGDFTDTSEDITAYAKSVTIKRGVSKTFDTIARDTTIDVVLNNADKRFSPDATGGLSGLKPGALVKVNMTYSTTATLGIGRIARDGIQVTQGTKLSREATLKTLGYLRMLQEERTVILPLMTNTTADAVITAIIDAIGLYPFSVASSWTLGEETYSELGISTILGASAGAYTDLDTGSDTLAYVGDVWGGETSAYAMIRDLAEAERGLLFEARDGTLTLISRRALLEDVSTAVDATLTGSNLVSRKKQDYRYGQDIVNDVTVTGYPRVVGTARSVVARLYAPAGTGHIIPAGQSRTFTLDYKTADGLALGAYDVVCESGTDYNVATWDSVNQVIIPVGVTVSLTITEGAGVVELTFDNPETNHAIITASATDANNITVRGYAVQSFDGVTANAYDLTSIAEVLRQPMRLDLKMLMSATGPQDMANYELYNRNDLRGGFTSITILANASATHAAWVRDLTISSRIALSETQTGTNREYFIVGEEHNIINALQEHYVTYTLRPAQIDYWILGVAGHGELDSTTRIGY